jgi:hypothetical protein
MSFSLSFRFREWLLEPVADELTVLRAEVALLRKEITMPDQAVLDRIKQAQDDINAAADARAQKVAADLQTLRDEISGLKDNSAALAALDSLENSVVEHVGQIDPDQQPAPAPPAP